MSTIGNPECETQSQMIALFRDRTRALKQGMMKELFTGRTRLA